MKKIALYLGVLVLFSLHLAGCGSGNSGTSGGTTIQPQTATGTFIDAPTEGLSYVSGSQRGITGSGGTFTYEVGKPVKFMVGDIVLGEAPGGSIITPLSLVKSIDSSATASDARVLNIVRFLLTVNSNTDTSRIVIPNAVATAAKGKTIDFSSDTQLQQVTAQISPKLLVDPGIAATHFNDTLTALTQPFVGTYALTNADTYVKIIVRADGSVTGEVTNIYQRGGYHTAVVTGILEPNGSFSGTTLVGLQSATLSGVFKTGGDASITTNSIENGVPTTTTFTGFKVSAIDAKYTGQYTATINNSGSGRFIVSTDGTLTGTVLNSHGENYAIEGAVSADGKVKALAVGPGDAVLTGTADGNGRISLSAISYDTDASSPSTTSFSCIRSISAYANLYSGSFTGTFNGTWSFGVDESGIIKGYVSNGQDIFGASGQVSSTVATPSTSFTLTVSDNATGSALARFNGNINAFTGQISGTWTALDTNGSGILTGGKR